MWEFLTPLLFKQKKITWFVVKEVLKCIFSVLLLIFNLDVVVVFFSNGQNDHSVI